MIAAHNDSVIFVKINWRVVVEFTLSHASDVLLGCYKNDKYCQVYIEYW